MMDSALTLISRIADFKKKAFELHEILNKSREQPLPQGLTAVIQDLERFSGGLIHLAHSFPSPNDFEEVMCVDGGYDFLFRLSGLRAVLEHLTKTHRGFLLNIYDLEYDPKTEGDAVSGWLYVSHLWLITSTLNSVIAQATALKDELLTEIDRGAVKHDGDYFKLPF